MLLVLASVVLALSSAPSAEEIRAQTREILADDGIQRSLPTESSTTPKARPVRPERGKLVRRSERSGLGALSSAMMYVLMIVGVGLVLFFFTRELFGFQADTEPELALGTPERDRGVVERPLGDAEALAASGDFAAAVHTLLLKTLMELSFRQQAPLPGSLTSREILDRVGLPGTAQAALAEIVDLVEISHFGNLPIGKDEWLRSKDSYARFSSAFLGAA